MRYLILPFVLAIFAGPGLCDEYSSKEKFLSRLLDKQVEQNISIERSVSVLLKRYPGYEEFILNKAFSNYPKQYRQIIRGAFNANPALSQDIIRLALTHQVDSCDKVIKTAIKAEPAYADDIVVVASKLHPDDRHHIVRMALKTKPVMATSIVNSTLDTYPNDFIEILSMAFDELPEMFSTLLNSVFRNHPEKSDAVIKVAVQNADKQHIRDIIDLAVGSGLDQDAVLESVLKAGADKELVAKWEEKH
ncbi:hypothetical protein [Thalassotalea aquiviva]|uniref:hypothetical protein n=1 Tax=Thalassotalea aquiviva TaxID=3242415 RepID=UPI00352A80FC